MVIESKNLGAIEYNVEDVIKFEKGLLGFEDETEFVIIRNNETEFYYLQSVKNEFTTFILVDLKDVMSNYDPKVEMDFIKDLGEIDHNLQVFNICNVKENLEELTVNLLGPIVINMDTKKGKQVVVSNDEGYSVKHKLFS